MKYIINESFHNGHVEKVEVIPESSCLFKGAFKLLVENNFKTKAPVLYHYLKEL